MKKAFVSIALTVACMGLGLAFGSGEPMSVEEKDRCLVISKSCEGISMSLQEKTKQLQEEIKKGKRVYTAEELKQLEMKLKEAEKALDMLIQENPYAR